MNKLFALIDCNNFYVSCERIFDQKLNNIPVVILSNNDGCIVARSNEAKQLNIPMGAPYYKYKGLLEYNNAKVLSSNYQLYGDISHRIMESIKMLAPGEVEVYSIDEAFVYLDSGNNESLLKLFESIREKILKWIGVPVSIGLGKTKTLAKLANYYAKNETVSGVFYFENDILQKDIMINLPIEKVWGISSRWGRKLRSLGYVNTYQLRHANTAVIRTHLGVVGLRIIKELQGESCIEIENLKPKKSIISSKSFGFLLSDINAIEEALSSYVARACEKLRLQSSKTQAICVFLHTNRYKLNEKIYSNSATIGLPYPTSNTGKIISVSKKLLEKIYKEGYRYKKAGVMLLDIVPNTELQYNLFCKNNDSRIDKLMQVVDSINAKHGSNTVFNLAQGLSKHWKMKCETRSPRYTTCWNELVRVT